MRSTIVLLKRGLTVPKRVWREPSFQRRLAPIEVAPLIASAWNAGRSELLERSCLELSLQLDGSPESAPTIHPMQGNQKAGVAVFDVSFVAEDGARVILREEECSRQLGTPRRHTRQIGLLRPWKPVRILLNGRSASSSGQHYSLREYHLVLCNEPVPEQTERGRLVDLQADLM